MMNLLRWGLPVFVTLSLSLFPSCDASKASKRWSETAFESKMDPARIDHSNPLSLTLVVNDTYAKKTACECIHYLASREYDELVEVLKKDYNIDLEMIYCIEEFHLEDSIQTQKYDGAICKPWTALQYQSKLGIKYSRIVDVIDPFENNFLAGSFIVRNESPIQNANDINDRVLFVGEENSYEKYHASMQLLHETGIKPKLIKSVSACTEGINALLDRVAEVAVISDYALVASCAVDLADDDAFRVIWQTEDMPLCSVMLDLDRVSKKDAARLQAALLEISDNKIPESFSSQGFMKPVTWVPNPYIAD